MYRSRCGGHTRELKDVFRGGTLHYPPLTDLFITIPWMSPMSLKGEGGYVRRGL